MVTVLVSCIGWLVYLFGLLVLVAVLTSIMGLLLYLFGLLVLIAVLASWVAYSILNGCCTCIMGWL